MSNAKFPLIEFDHTNALNDNYGVTQQDLDGLASQLEGARREILEVDIPLFDSGDEIPSGKQPLDTAFVKMPERLLSEYQKTREESELGQIIATATRIRESCDRVVTLGIGGSYMGAKALMDTCCHPFHNELTRAQRGSRPRMYFEGNNVDNDALSGLLQLLSENKSASPEDWAVVCISKSGGTLETAASFRIFLDQLREHCGGDREKLASLVVPVTGTSGKLFDLATAIGCPNVFNVPEGVGGRFSILSPVGLLPAAILGIDVVRLLEGAAAMTEHFATAPINENVVLDYTAVCHSMYQRRNANLRLLSMWSKSLETAGLWYDQLLAESLGKAERGATPLTVVNTRDLHSRAQQHQEGSRDKLINNVIVKSWRCDAQTIPESHLDQDQLNAIAGKTFPELMTAAIAGTNQAYLDDQRPTTDLILPKVDEASMGQFFQMMMIATVVEGRIMGINPYGQPGVEQYKRHMKSNLDQ